MRMTLFFLFFSILFSSAANSFSQEFTFNQKSASIREICKQIEKESDYVFVFSDNSEKMIDQKVNIDANAKNVAEILDVVLSNTELTYEILDKQIVIYEADKTISAKVTEHKIPETIIQQPPRKQITGRVTDAGGQPLPGVTVVVKGTTMGTVTDADGVFSLDIPLDAETLQFSFVGMRTQELLIDSRSTFTVMMEEEAIGLEEVVAIGYGTIRKSDLTGAVSSVKVDELREGVTTSVDQMLFGKSAGVNVIQNSGEPGGGISINIRGASSITAGNSPLYVIDGVPIDNSRPISTASVTGFNDNRSPRNPLASINPSDIESIEILKDASAAAIYGSRGANGVILITTKGGQEGQMQINYHGYVGIQNRANKLDLLNAQEYQKVINDIIDAGGGLSSEKVVDIANEGKGTDWQDEINNPNALVQDHQLSFSGGTSKTSYYVSLNYMDQEGIMKNTEFNRYGARVNLRSEINEKLNFGLNATGSYTQDSYIANGFGINEWAGALYAAYNFDPTLPVKDEEGNYALSPFLTVDNPVALSEGMNSESNSNRILASAFGEYHFTSNLFAKINIGYDFVNEGRKSFVSSLTKEGRNNGGIAANQNVEKNNYLIEGTINYNKSFGIHLINTLLGTTYQRFVTSRMNNTASDFLNESLGADNLGIGNQSTFDISNSVTGNRLASYIGRINYSLNDKYLATATLRADGSSRFGKNHKFGFFPSVALAWRISDETFLKDIDILSSLKFRLSWGRTGNQEIGDYPSLTTYSQGESAIWGGVQVTGTQPARIPNPDLKWETTEQTNVGLDFGFFNNRINGSLDYYEKQTRDMLLNLPIPQSTGFNSILSNVGRIDNKGFEVLINTVNLTSKQFSWRSDLTFTTMKNEVKDLGSIPEIIIGAGYTHVEQVAIIKPGLPLNSYYGWEIDGIWQEGDDFSDFTEDYQPGDLKYVDQNGDKIINNEDRVVLGNSIPDFQWSFGNTFTYKNFDLFVFIEGVEGVQMLNGNLIDNYFPVNFRRNKFAEPYLNRWTPENPSNKYPSFVDPLKFGRRVVNSNTLLDASYMRLKTIRLSYTLPKIIQSIQSAQVYLTGENLFTLTDYMGLDPAVNPNNDPNFRMDLNAYPTARTLILGINIVF